MSRLIYANMVRMIKSKVFWISEIFLTGYSVFVYAMAAVNVRNLGMVNNGWTVYFFNEMLFIHVVMEIGRAHV